jgi:hypothetical protein
MLLLLPALLGGCSGGEEEPSVAGGQSGTEGHGSQGCREDEPVDVPLDETLAELATSPLEVLAQLEKTPDMPGVWFDSGRSSSLSLRAVGDAAARVVTSSEEGGLGTLCSYRLEIKTQLRVTSHDGILDQEVSATVQASPGLHTVRAQLSELDAESWLPPAGWQDQSVTQLSTFLGSAPGLVLGGIFGVEERERLKLLVEHDGALVAFWSDGRLPSPLPAGNPVLHVPEPELAESCGGAEPLSMPTELLYTPYSNLDAALEGLAGAYARCVDTKEGDHVGLQIHPDGSWNQLVLVDGALLPRFGFGREGYVQLRDVSVMNGKPGLVQLDLHPFSFTLAYEPALVFYPAAPHWPSTVYLRTALPVASATEVAYAPGERAGIPACGVPERGVVPPLAAADEALLGDFVLCSGELAGGVTGLRFSSGSVELLGADEASLGTYSLSIDQFNAPQLTLYVRRAEAVSRERLWFIEVSRQPLKLRIREASDAWPEPTAVFSALP